MLDSVGVEDALDEMTDLLPQIRKLHAEHSDDPCFPAIAVAVCRARNVMKELVYGIDWRRVRIALADSVEEIAEIGLPDLSSFDDRSGPDKIAERQRRNS